MPGHWRSLQKGVSRTGPNRTRPIHASDIDEKTQPLLQGQFGIGQRSGIRDDARQEAFIVAGLEVRGSGNHLKADFPEDR
jgi:hypothetical protein